MIPLRINESDSLPPYAGMVVNERLQTLT